LIVEVSLSEEKIKNMLNEFKSSGRGDPFLYSDNDGFIGNQSANKTLILEVIRSIQERAPHSTPTFTLNMGGKGYLVNMIQSKTIGWYLIDYVSLQDVLAPINKSRNLFHAGLAILLIMGFITSYGLYRQVQRPIRSLISAVKRLKAGDYSFRLKTLPKNEFAFLFIQFNEMVVTIQELMEKVVVEKLHTREAVLKQLQSQIDPHFLYNCLGFIANMTKLHNEEAVLAMAYNLSDYYRYTTRLEKKVTTLREEIKLVTHYLEIQNLRMNRIRYEIRIPDEMLDMQVPLLILQPIVENSIIHGIQKKIGAGTVRITGKYEEHNTVIIVDDDGPGMDEGQLQRLRQKIREALDDEVGCGMWNVHKRLTYFCSEGAGLAFEPSPLGGLKTVLSFGDYSLQKERDDNERAIG
jgi:two-component system sensor histidine kinase YesM